MRLPEESKEEWFLKPIEHGFTYVDIPPAVPPVKSIEESGVLQVVGMFFKNIPIGLA